MLLLVFLIAPLLALLASATPASAQFRLSTQTQASACFINCHKEFTAVHPLPDGRVNFSSAIGINCGYEVRGRSRAEGEARGREPRATQGRAKPESKSG